MVEEAIRKHQYREEHDLALMRERHRWTTEHSSGDHVREVLSQRLTGSAE